MKIYVEAIEEGNEENPEVIREEMRSDASDDTQTLNTVNSQLTQGRTYKKRIHYCRQTTDNPCENKPCIIEEIVNDTITYNNNPRTPNIQDGQAQEIPAQEGGGKGGNPQIGQ